MTAKEAKNIALQAVVSNNSQMDAEHTYDSVMKKIEVSARKGLREYHFVGCLLSEDVTRLVREGFIVDEWPVGNWDLIKIKW